MDPKVKGTLFVYCGELEIYYDFVEAKYQVLLLGNFVQSC